MQQQLKKAKEAQGRRKGGSMYAPQPHRRVADRQRRASSRSPLGVSSRSLVSRSITASVNEAPLLHSATSLPTKLNRAQHVENTMLVMLAQALLWRGEGYSCCGEGRVTAHVGVYFCRRARIPSETSR